MSTRRLVFVTIVVLGSGVSVHGHHAFAAYYLEDQTVTITGELIAFEYRNPHAWVRVGAVDNSGRLQKVSAEWANPGRLNQQGITKDTLKPGERLVLTGSPSRQPSEYTMHLKRIERPADGWTWVGRAEKR